MISADEQIGQQLAAFETKIKKIAASMPVAAFTTNPLWQEARWSATTFRWHPTSEAPPVMGLVFENADAGLQLFRELEAAYNHVDRFEEMRVSIIEGSPNTQQPGYSVHLGPEPDALAMHATGEELVVDAMLSNMLSRWNRMYPIPGSPRLLPKFKEEFKKHGEFLLAPVTRKPDGQNYFNSELGFIKHTIEFRTLADIVSKDDLDVAALVIPALIQPKS